MKTSRFKWKWLKTSENLGIQAQQKLLEIGGLDFSDSSKGNNHLSARLFKVPVSNQTLNLNPTKTPHFKRAHQAVCASKIERVPDPDTDTFLNTLVVGNPSKVTSKPSMVMLHGFGAGLGFFYKNYAPLAPYFSSIYALDFLGMGLSSRPPFPKPLKKGSSDKEIVDAAEDFFISSLEEWRQFMKLDKMTLVAHSLGGYLGAAYALKYPMHVEKLILVSPVGVPHRPPGLLTRKGGMLFRLYKALWLNGFTPQTLIRGLGPHGRRLVKTYATRRFAHLSSEEIEALDSYIYHITAQRGSGEYAVSRLLLPGAYARIPLDFPSLSCPTTFLYGDHDWMDHRHALLRANEIPGPCKIGLVHKAGHHLYNNNPQGFNSMLLREFGYGENSSSSDSASDEAISNRSDTSYPYLSHHYTPYHRRH